MPVFNNYNGNISAESETRKFPKRCDFILIESRKWSAAVIVILEEKTFPYSHENTIQLTLFIWYKAKKQISYIKSKRKMIPDWIYLLLGL